MENGDDEALVRTSAPTALVAYDIVHSPTYQVPVLYVRFKPPSRVLTTDEVYSLLTPESRRLQLRAVGTMGALSMTDHPITGQPAYFMHPCRTQEAMGAVTADRSGSLRPEEYLLMWLGLVGPSVGLNVPLELARAVSQHRQAVKSLQESEREVLLDVKQSKIPTVECILRI